MANLAFRPQRFIVDDSIAYSLCPPSSRPRRHGGRRHARACRSRSLVYLHAAAKMDALTPDAVEKGARSSPAARGTGIIVEATLLDHVTPAAIYLE